MPLSKKNDFLEDSNFFFYCIWCQKQHSVLKKQTTFYRVVKFFGFCHQMFFATYMFLPLSYNTDQAQGVR